MSLPQYYNSVVCCLLEATSAVHVFSQTKTALLDFTEQPTKIFYNFHLYAITEDIQKRIQEITVNQSKGQYITSPLHLD